METTKKSLSEQAAASQWTPLAREMKKLHSMMESCYAYGTLKISDKYIDNIRRDDWTHSDELFTETFNKHAKYLKENFIVKSNVYTCSDGVNYNELVEIDWMNASKLRKGIRNMSKDEMISLRDHMERNWTDSLRPLMDILSLGCINKFKTTISRIDEQ